MQRKLSEYWVCQDLANMKKVINLRLMTNIKGSARMRTQVINLRLVTNIRGSARMRTQVINLRLMTNHDVAGSEAEESASSIMMTNVPYLNIN